jgi:hypothetical protein
LQRLSSSVGIAILVTVLAGQFATAARQTTCAPPATVVIAAAGVLHQPALTAQQYCAYLEQKIAASSAQESSGSSQPSTGNVVLDTFNRQYAGGVFSDAFDRTFVLIAVLSAIGIIPAFFLKRPDRQPSESSAVPMAA